MTFVDEIRIAETLRTMLVPNAFVTVWIDKFLTVVDSDFDVESIYNSALRGCLKCTCRMFINNVKRHSWAACHTNLRSVAGWL